ncbi:MAG: NADH-quinone oxidoreductase subunit M [Planctomycetota bacterium]|nr:NADH-quinone oxidoreductase subunit M [Planctomycetota bacterium]
MDSLTVLTFLPLVGAFLVMAMPASQTKAIRLVALATTVITGVIGLSIYAGFDGASAAMQNTCEAPWFTLPGTDIAVAYRLGLDGISVLMVGLTAIIMPIVILSTYGHIHDRVKEFFVWMLIMETGMLGVFLSMDIVLFYVFWEVSLVPLYFLVGIWGGDQRIYATVKFFLYTVAGSLVMLVAIIAMILALQTTNMETMLATASTLPLADQSWMFFAFALAFCIKVPVLPFHTWLADAHTQAPTSGSVLLAGVLLKMGTYGLIRFAIGFFPMMALEHQSLFMGLGAVGIVYGAFLAMAQTDIKRLIACSSVSHLGFVVMGMFALTETGMRGSILQMVNHGLSTGLLFLLIGMVYERRHTRLISDFGGIAASMPIFAVFFIISMLSSVGLPGLNGFVGEFMILAGSFEASPMWGAIGVTGVIFGAVYLLSATRRMLFGPLTRDENRNLTDINLREIGLMVPMVILCFWMGVQPNAFLDKLDGSIGGEGGLMQRIEAAKEQRANNATLNLEATAALSAIQLDENLMEVSR